MNVREEIARRRKEWQAAVNGGDVSSYGDLVTEDVVWLPPMGSPIEGREGFRSWLEPFFEEYDYDFLVEPTRVRPFDGWCAEGGTFASSLTPRAGGEAQRHVGSYAVLWRKDRHDGRWRIERYIDGFEAPPGESDEDTRS